MNEDTRNHILSVWDINWCLESSNRWSGWARNDSEWVAHKTIEMSSWCSLIANTRCIFALKTIILDHPLTMFVLIEKIFNSCLFQGCLWVRDDEKLFSWCQIERDWLLFWDVMEKRHFLILCRYILKPRDNKTTTWLHEQDELVRFLG